MSIPLQDFYFLNLEIDANCSNLILGHAYCVAPVGSIYNYPNYTGAGGNGASLCASALAPSSCFGQVTSLPTASYIGGNVSITAVPKGTQPPNVTPTIASSTLLPTALGTISGCAQYRNYQATNQTLTTNNTMTVNSCNYLSILYGVGISDLETWNPSLSQQSCVLQVGFSYCVQRTSIATGWS